MQELSLKDRLQPALLDRLTDEERLLTIFRIKLDPARMQAHKVSEETIDRVLTANGFKRLRDGSAVKNTAMPVLEYLAARSAAASPRSLKITGVDGAPDIPLTDCCEVEVSTVANGQLESADRRAMSMRRLREAVLRDLGWLLNASGIDDIVDLERFPQVRRSVVNFGLRSQAGRAISSLDPTAVARSIRDAIMYFEPRLSEVRVVPEAENEAANGMLMSFLVEAELWGQPVAQHVSLRTSIDVGSGDVVVLDRAARP